ncbi:MAG TPA: signal peptidase II [Thermotogaceae bacterium]|nr:signal peptidase II [Thermotogaceae bacterium]
MALIVTAIAVLILDQVSKLIIKNILDYGQMIYLLGNFLKLTYINNSGIAFGFLQGKFYLIIIMISFTIFLLIVTAIKLKKLSKLSKVFLGMIIGGALGNFTDRLLFKNVVDFISIFDFPVFNAADSSIVLGTIFLGIRLLFYEKLESDGGASRDDNGEVHSDSERKRMEIGQISDEQITILDFKNNDPKSNKDGENTGKRSGEKNQL